MLTGLTITAFKPLIHQLIYAGRLFDSFRGYDIRIDDPQVHD